MLSQETSMKFLLGTAQLSRPYGVVRADRSAGREGSAARLAAAKILGFSGLDTAPAYGAAEEEIGKSGVNLPVYTKLDPTLSAEESIRQSRARLRRSFLDGVYLHEEYVASRSQKEILRRLQDRKTEDIGLVGVSIYSVREFQIANENPDIDLIQLPFSVFDRRFNAGYLSENLDASKKVFARSIFLQGVLLKPASQLPPPVQHLRNYKALLEEATRGSGLDYLEIALGYAMKNEAINGIIVGSTSFGELREVCDRVDSVREKNLSSVIDFNDVPAWDAVDPRKWSIS